MNSLLVVAGFAAGFARVMPTSKGQLMTRYAPHSDGWREIDHGEAIGSPTSTCVDAYAEPARSGGTTGPAVDPIGRHAPVGLPCQVHDAELWFADAPAELERAKALCAGCPARSACLTGALRRHEPAGVWGGQILQAGRVVPFKRPRGRPPKNGRTPAACRRLPPGVRGTSRISLGGASAPSPTTGPTS